MTYPTVSYPLCPFRVSLWTHQAAIALQAYMATETEPDGTNPKLMIFHQQVKDRLARYTGEKDKDLDLMLRLAQDDLQINMQRYRGKVFPMVLT